jgi:hypothetical protein
MTASYSGDYLSDQMEAVTGGQPNPQAALYLSLQQTPEHEARLADAWQFMMDPRHSTPAFHQPGLVPVGSAMVISSQETAYLPRTLAQFSRQVGPLPFRQLGYLNWDGNATKQEIRATRRILTDFIANPKNEHVPLAFFEGEIEEPFTMGQVRRLPADALLPLIAKGGLLMNHDADLVYMNEGHFAALYDGYREAALVYTEPPSAAVPTVTHSRAPELPGIDRILRWNDDPEVMMLTDMFFEMGAAIRVEDYILQKGYNIEDKIAETHKLIARIALGSVKPRRVQHIRTAQLITSNRRYVEKLSGYGDINAIWTDDNFLPREQYRSTGPDKLHTYSDLSDTMADAYLLELGHTILQRTINVLNRHKTLNPTAEATHCLEAIRARLGGPENMFVDNPHGREAA